MAAHAEPSSADPSEALGPNDGPGCERDADCVLTDFDGSCCDCCPSPPRPVHVAVLAGWRETCATMECVADPECAAVDCPPEVDDDPAGARCDRGRCVRAP